MGEGMIPVGAREWDAMGLALAEAARSREVGEIPVGAVVLGPDDEVLGRAHNARVRTHDPTGHAEILAIRAAAERVRDRILSECTLVVTLEPCVMCAGAIMQARIPRVWFGAWDVKAGAAGSVYDVLRDTRLPYPRVEVIPEIRRAECADLLRGFFEERRAGGGH